MKPVEFATIEQEFQTLINQNLAIPRWELIREYEFACPFQIVTVTDDIASKYFYDVPQDDFEIGNATALGIPTCYDPNIDRIVLRKKDES